MTHKQKYRLPTDWENAVTAWASWLTASGVSPATRHLRRSHIRAIAKRSETEHPKEITLAMLVGLCSEEQWSKEHRRGVRRSLIAFFDFALAQAWVPESPAKDLPKVPGGEINPRPLPDRLWEQLLLSAPPRERMMARLAGQVGMRRAEVACCHRDDLIEDLTGFSLLIHGKGGKERIVPLTDSVAQAIMDFCDQGYLFPGQEDGHLSAMYVGKLISGLMPQSWSMHKLRHRFATKGLRATGNLLAVRDALGHASVATTQVYTKGSRDDVRRVVAGACDEDD